LKFEALLTSYMPVATAAQMQQQKESAEQCVAVCCRVLQYVAVRCSVLQCVALWYSVLQCVAAQMQQQVCGMLDEKCRRVALECRDTSDILSRL